MESQGSGSGLNYVKGIKRGGIFLVSLTLLSLFGTNLAAHAASEKSYNFVPTNIQGENTIAEYTWDASTGKLTPQYYNLELAKTEFGEGDNVKYYEMTKNESNTYEIKEIDILPADKTNDIITVYYGDTHERISGDMQGASINGDFVDITGKNGGAILCNGYEIGNIDSSFIGNVSKTSGGGIFVFPGKIGDINGDFIANTANQLGGAIAHWGTEIGNIKGDFIGNTAYGQGGALDSSYIKSITGDFIRNKSFGGDGGGAIAGLRSDYIEGNFIQNEARGTFGGALYKTKIHTIIGDFIQNKSGYAGGAISLSDIHLIKGNFIANSVPGCAGAIQSEGAKDNNTYIYGNFIANHSVTHGGAIVNEGAHYALIEGDFIANYVENTISDVTDADNYVHYSFGGAIDNDRCGGSGIDKINGNFIGNYISSVESPVYGGALANFYDEGGHIGTINGDFLGNYVKSEQGSAHGGAYVGLAEAWINQLNGDFRYNHVTSDTLTSGGAIYNQASVIGEINGDLVSNYALSNNSNSYGGAIYNESQIGGNYTNLNGETKQGAIRGNIINNYAKTESSDKLALGGGIFTSGDIVLEADNKTNLISGNYTEDFRGRRNSGIFVRTNKAVLNSNKDGYNYETNTPIITINTKNQGKYVINDVIEGGELKGVTLKNSLETLEEVTLDDVTYENKYDLKLTGDSTGTVVLNNDVKNANLILDNTNLYLGRENVLDASNINLNSGILSMINNRIGISKPENLTLTGNTKVLVDVDLKNQTMDRFSAQSYGKHQGNLIVSGMNLISDNPTPDLEILFAEKGLKNNVVNAAGSLPGEYQTEAFSPIYRYTVDYANREDGGYFVFNQGGLNSSNPSFKYNPAVLATPASAEAGGQSIVNETVRFAFQHADMFSQMPYVERVAYINQNKYAISDGNPKYSHDFEQLNKGAWVKPFTSFEKINLKNGPDVDAITYGTLIGLDSNFNELKHGWYNVHTAYIGYNGSSLSYKGVDTTLNGGLLGMTETFYKGNFFTAVTATAGASVGENSTMYGKENYTMLLGGVGSKTGYDFEFKNGKYILQPIIFMNYSYVNTFDYTTASGVRMNNSPFHTVQVNPAIKATMNLDNGWQPYVNIGFVWNVLNSGKVSANNVVLPHMSVDPYVEYGVGVQKKWKDKFTGYVQAMVRNGGRNGLALTFGFRWALGNSAERL